MRRRAHLGEYGSDLSRAAVLARAADAPKAAAFREQHCYSNLGFVIAAEAVSRLVNDRPRTDVIDAANTAWARGRAKAVDRFAADKKVDPIDPATALPLTAFAGQYRNRGFGELTLTVDGEALRFAIANGSHYDGWLVRYGATGFAYQDVGFSGRRAPRPRHEADARLRFQIERRQVVGLEWLDMWFGASSFARA